MDGLHIALVLGLCAAVAAFLYQMVAARKALTRLARAEEREKAREHECASLTALKDDVSVKFQGLADAALRQSQSQFLEMATQTLSRQKEGVSGDLRTILKPVEEKFSEFGKKVDDIRKISAEERQTMKDQIKHTSEMLLRASKETNRLTSALSAPRGGGRWGEETLRNVLELSGMSEHCDFAEQAHSRSDDGHVLRPDVVIRLPGKRCLIVDAKAPMDKYLLASNEEDAEKRARYLDDHAKSVRQHVRILAQKDYWRQFDQSPDFVAMFIPGENFYSAALARDAALFDDAARSQIIIVTPATLLALAKAVAFGWRQEKAAENAMQAARLGKELHTRLKTMLGHLRNAGEGLNRAVKAHNDMVGSIESRVLPSARRFEDLQTTGADDRIELAPPVDRAVRLPSEDSGTR